MSRESHDSEIRSRDDKVRQLQATIKEKDSQIARLQAALDGAEALNKDY